ncbi:serpin B [Paragonimus westermani]|uniref:Serpin B n=1 Tax=Paragonimus westermani TaxID=34504 RepID=A0A5J4N440_9TREM|nr:serpin B [Paragonimus westermani]KAA3675130.1 serpin B [Paragonimus westermani]KAA3677187.1 serpin B [Paragonimus westermani]
MKVNNWVADKTGGVLTDLLPPGIIDQDTRLALITASYFTGSWKEKFDRSQTKDSDFFLLKGGAIKVSMMFREDSFSICAMDRLDAKVLKLPFADDRWDLYIILPKGKNDLPKLLQRYAKNVGLSGIISCDFREKPIGLYLPRFVLGATTHVNATKVIQSLGIIDMFTKKANFSSLTGGPNVTASEVIHQSVMKVGEQGGTAPASHAHVKFSKPQPDIPVFRADHPFMLMVVYNGTIPVFVGHYVGPESNSN